MVKLTPKESDLEQDFMDEIHVRVDKLSSTQKLIRARELIAIIKAKKQSKQDDFHEYEELLYINDGDTRLTSRMISKSNYEWFTKTKIKS